MKIMMMVMKMIIILVCLTKNVQSNKASYSFVTKKQHYIIEVNKFLVGE
jgi:hypothetical protein